MERFDLLCRAPESEFVAGELKGRVVADEAHLKFLVGQLDRLRDRHRVLEDQKTLLTRSMTELRDMCRMLERLEHRDRKPEGKGSASPNGRAKRKTGDPPQTASMPRWKKSSRSTPG